MEGSEYTERTLQVFHQVRREYDNVGAVIQAYLRRSKSDVALINRIPGRARLCKGACSSEPVSKAYQGRDEVNRNMKDLLRDLMLAGDYPGIASHDEIIQEAITISQRYQIPAEKFEFQMLYGIRRDKQNELYRQGYNVRIYVPLAPTGTPTS